MFSIEAATPPTPLNHPLRRPDRLSRRSQRSSSSSCTLVRLLLVLLHSDMATTNFENDALSLYRIQNCIRRSLTFSRPHRIWTSGVTKTLTNTQLAARRQLVAGIVNDMSPHQRRYKTCSCGSSDVLPLWPRNTLCPALVRPAESDALDPELDVAMNRLAYAIAINPPEDGPALLHDLRYRAIRSRLLVDNKTWPWTTAVDLWACESHLARRLGFDTFPGAYLLRT